MFQQLSRKQLLREDVLNAHGRKCVRCGKKDEDEKLQMHHIKPQSLGGLTVKENLLPLCQICHTKTHKEWEQHMPIPEGIIHN